MPGFLPDLPFARRGYHHGRLREALLAAARALVAEHGPHGFSLADAAKAAGVSSAAPYRHFSDRRALLAAIAAEGFVALGARLRAARGAAEAGADGPSAAALAMARAYLAFARAERGWYAAMFEAGLGAADHGDGAPEAWAFEALADGLGVAGPSWDVEARRRVALGVWALLHGIATLERGGEIAGPAAASAIAEAGVRALLGAGPGSATT